MTRPNHKDSSIKIRALGTGTSMGVPVVGCDCPICTSDDPRNRRMRSSISLQVDSRWLLIDCSIDFRMQMLQWPMPRIDAILLTHTHSDHVNGIDDLRSYNYLQKEAIPLYSEPYFLEDLKLRFNYCFNPRQKGGGVPQMDLMPIRAGEFFCAAGIDVLPVRIMHGNLPILGYRIGPFAYLTDCSGIPEPTGEQLRGVDTLILSALRQRPHPTHFSLDQSVAAAERLGVRRVFFTHIADEMDHAETNKKLPDWAQLLYDGQFIEVPLD